ncbi:Di-copper centre-containing protein [Auriculariales sp. MPI-PUGE-AT-0066]|nr:Di-copper centre-containing protein [Auriculariales sp. MPI-PUGE-AT-0066]
MTTVNHNIIISGAPEQGGGNRVYPRRPIEELVHDEKQFSLYVQATTQIMADPTANMLSWFQVSGIHGLPATPWDNVAGVADPEFPGYCWHASLLFPTWHRPYVLLFEQALVSKAVAIAGNYHGPDANEWLQAAYSLRSPYWDWAVNAIPPAEVIELPQLTVKGPQGPLTLKNPLLSYVYKAGEQIDPLPYTVRNPGPGNPPQSNIAALKDSLRVLINPNDPMSARVYDTLTDPDTWEEFSNKRTTPGSFRNSIESIHDLIHVLVGGNGQMADPSYAAFDPMFWLHHTNVDRLLALWQALHPNVWVSRARDNGEAGNFSAPPGVRVSATTDLEPFWDGRASFFKSTEIRDWNRLHYTYPEFLKVPPGQDPEATIRAAVERLYGDEKDQEPTPNEGGEQPPVPPPQQPGHPQVPIPAPGPDTDQFPVTFDHGATDGNPNTRIDWLARIAYAAGKADSSFSILFFFGAPPASEHDWRTADNLVGIHSEFINSRPAHCDNCRRNVDEGLVTEGFIRLTRPLKKYGVYDRPTVEVDKFLQDELQWRIQKIDAKIIDVSEADGLKVEIMTLPLALGEGGWRKRPGAHPHVRHTTRGGRPTEE